MNLQNKEDVTSDNLAVARLQLVPNTKKDAVSFEVGIETIKQYLIENLNTIHTIQI